VKLTEVATAARNVADYIDKHGDGSDICIVIAQLKLATDRLLVIQQMRVSDMAEHVVEEQGIWGEL